MVLDPSDPCCDHRPLFPHRFGHHQPEALRQAFLNHDVGAALLGVDDDDTLVCNAEADWLDVDETLASKGVVVGDLAAVPSAREWLGTCSDTSRDPFVDLHDGFLAGGAFIFVPDGVVVERPFIRDIDFAGTEKATPAELLESGGRVLTRHRRQRARQHERLAGEWSRLIQGRRLAFQVHAGLPEATNQLTVARFVGERPDQGVQRVHGSLRAVSGAAPAKRGPTAHRVKSRCCPRAKRFTVRQ